MRKYKPKGLFLLLIFTTFLLFSFSSLQAKAASFDYPFVNKPNEILKSNSRAKPPGFVPDPPDRAPWVTAFAEVWGKDFNGLNKWMRSNATDMGYYINAPLENEQKKSININYQPTMDMVLNQRNREALSAKIQRTLDRPGQEPLTPEIREKVKQLKYNVENEEPLIVVCYQNFGKGSEYFPMTLSESKNYFQFDESLIPSPLILDGKTLVNGQDSYQIYVMWVAEYYEAVGNTLATPVPVTKPYGYNGAGNNRVWYPTSAELKSWVEHVVIDAIETDDYKVELVDPEGKGINTGKVGTTDYKVKVSPTKSNAEPTEVDVPVTITGVSIKSEDGDNGRFLVGTLEKDADIKSYFKDKVKIVNLEDQVITGWSMDDLTFKIKTPSWTSVNNKVGKNNKFTVEVSYTNTNGELYNSFVKDDRSATPAWTVEFYEEVPQGGDVTVNYYRKGTTDKVADTKTITGKVGADWKSERSTSLTNGGVSYTLDSVATLDGKNVASTPEVSGTFTSNKQTVNYYYIKEQTEEPPKIVLQKKDEKGAPLPGAKFIIQRQLKNADGDWVINTPAAANGNVVFTTNRDGQIVISSTENKAFWDSMKTYGGNPDNFRFRFREIEAPKDYAQPPSYDVTAKPQETNGDSKLKPFVSEVFLVDEKKTVSFEIENKLSITKPETYQLKVTMFDADDPTKIISYEPNDKNVLALYSQSNLISNNTLLSGQTISFSEVELEKGKLTYRIKQIKEINNYKPYDGANEELYTPVFGVTAAGNPQVGQTPAPQGGAAEESGVEARYDSDKKILSIMIPNKPKDKPFSITINKRGDSETGTPLAGAVFELQSYRNGKWSKETETGVQNEFTTMNPTGQIQVPQAVLDHIKKNQTIKYRFEETKAPDGYTISSNPYVPNKDGFNYTDDIGDVSYTVINKKKYTLHVRVVEVTDKDKKEFKILDLSELKESDDPLSLYDESRNNTNAKSVHAKTGNDSPIITFDTELQVGTQYALGQDKSLVSHKQYRGHPESKYDDDVSPGFKLNDDGSIELEDDTARTARGTDTVVGNLVDHGFELSYDPQTQILTATIANSILTLTADPVPQEYMQYTSAEPKDYTDWVENVQIWDEEESTVDPIDEPKSWTVTLKDPDTLDVTNLTLDPDGTTLKPKDYTVTVTADYSGTNPIYKGKTVSGDVVVPVEIYALNYKLAIDVPEYLEFADGQPMQYQDQFLPRKEKYTDWTIKVTDKRKKPEQWKWKMEVKLRNEFAAYYNGSLRELKDILYYKETANSEAKFLSTKNPVPIWVDPIPVSEPPTTEAFEYEKSWPKNAGFLVEVGWLDSWSVVKTAPYYAKLDFTLVDGD